MNKLDTFKIVIAHKTDYDFEDGAYSYLETSVLINGQAVGEYTDISAFITNFNVTNSREKEVAAFHIWDKKLQDYILRKDDYEQLLYNNY